MSGNAVVLWEGSPLKRRPGFESVRGDGAFRPSRRMHDQSTVF